MSTIAVIGGGIAGLTAAYRLSSRHDVVVFESEATAGGKIRSQHVDGFLFEWGPAGFLSSAGELQTLVADAGLADAVLEAAPAAKNRYICWDGKLHKVPSKPPDVLRMRLLSPGAKLRALAEVFVPRRAGGDGALDESVFDFMARRFGRQVAERLVAPVVLGVSGGDAAATSLAALFPRLPGFEAESGSVIRGLLRGPRKPARMCSFRAGGMQRLTDRLAEHLGPRLRLGTAVRGLERRGTGWRVAYDGGEALVDGVIVTTPSAAAAGLVAGFDADLAARLREIAYAPMRTAGVAFRAADVAAPLDAFGFLAARGSGVRILGAAYTSSIVPEQAPPDTVYLRVFLGGATDPEAVSLDMASARAIVLADLAAVLGITAKPVAYHEAIWREAIPQYALGHRATVKLIEGRQSAHPSFALTGNAYRGLGVGDTVTDAVKTAARF